MFVINEGPIDLPFHAVRLENDRGNVTGSDWDVVTLEDGNCVAIWKKEGNPSPPGGISCNEEGRHLERSGGEKFWVETFEVFYNDRLLGTCEVGQDVCGFEFAIGP